MHDRRFVLEFALRHYFNPAVGIETWNEVGELRECNRQLRWKLDTGEGGVYVLQCERECVNMGVVILLLDRQDMFLTQTLAMNHLWKKL